MKKSGLVVCLVLGIVLAMSFAISATESQTPTSSNAVVHEADDDQVDETEIPDRNVPMDDQDTDEAIDEEEEEEDTTPTFLRGFGRFLSSKKKKKAPKPKTCDKSIKICRTKGSTKRDCCKKKCVSKDTDKQNCGKCGKKCKFSQTCCKGKCINTMSDKNNCGGCKRKCKKGRKCRYGMCSYAYY